MEPVKLFISYSHKDEYYLKQLITHLTPLKRLGLIREWCDRKITPGEEWDKLIKKELLESEIILLLVSADFLASSYCYDIEITEAIDRHDQGKAIVIPIILRPCSWKDLPFSKIQGLPNDAKPLSTWTNIDEGYTSIIEGIRKAINKKKESENIERYTNVEIEYISFPHDVIIGKLPRGYVTIQGIEFIEKLENRTITIDYFDYNGNWRHGTHYHDSYSTFWDGPSRQEIQLTKLKIQKGDWRFGRYVLQLTIDLINRSKLDQIEDILLKFNVEYVIFKYFKKFEKIPKPIVPIFFKKLSKIGEIKDIIEDLKGDDSNSFDLKNLHNTFELNGQRAYSLLYKLLGENDPSVLFIKKILNRYDETLDLEQLKDWGIKLGDALLEACDSVK